MDNTIWLPILLIIAAVFAIPETIAIRDRLPGNTLSATWWAVREAAWVRILVFAPLAWLLWHLFSPWDTSTGGWDDITATLTGATIGLWLKYPERRGA